MYRIAWNALKNLLKHCGILPGGVGSFAGVGVRGLIGVGGFGCLSLYTTSTPGISSIWSNVVEIGNRNLDLCVRND